MVPSEPIQITEDNANQVAAGIPMAASLIGFQETMGFQALTAEGTGTFAGPDGGTITAGFEIDAVPVGVVSTGDRFTVNFDDCMLGASVALNGGIVIDFNTINGDWTVDDVWEVDLGFQLDNLVFASGPTRGYFDGSWSQNTSHDNGDAAFSLAGDFTTSVNDGTDLVSAALSGLVLDWSYDALAAEATYSVDGQFASNLLGGSVVVTTLTPFVLKDTNLDPHTGVMRATGVGDSSLTFTVLDETFVRLDVDADGDGIDEFSVTTTWAELEEN